MPEEETPEPATLYVRLPSTVHEWWDDSAIALWVYENVYRVMQERTQVQISQRDTGNRSCRVTIEGIPNAKRRRIRDLLRYTRMEQCIDPNGDTGEIFDTP